MNNNVQIDRPSKINTLPKITLNERNTLRKLNGASVLLAVLIIWGGCSRGEQTPGGSPFGNMPQRAASVEVIDIQRQPISRQIRSFGNVRAQDNVTVVPQVSERVTGIFADLGDTVQVGQVLAKLRDVTFADQVRRDMAQLEQARIAVERDSTNFTRSRELYSRELISSSEFDNARSTFLNSRANFESVSASLTQSRENLANTEIRSPVRGVVTRRNISVGDLASGGQPSFELSNLVGYEVRLFVPLQDRRLIRVGQQSQLRISGEPEFAARGVVARISPEIDPVTGLTEVVITITSHNNSLFPGALTEVLTTVETRPSAIVIPRVALVENVQTLIDPETNTIRLARTYSAFVTRDDTLAIRRDLELGIEQGDRIEVISGLDNGDRLIITGQAGLENESRIRVSGMQRGPRQSGVRPDTAALSSGNPDNGNN
jgi:RND family efflux transporter MFP subunit